MKFTLSDDRIVNVKQLEGCLTVIVKQKDSNVKFAEFTPNRCIVLILLLASVHDGCLATTQWCPCCVHVCHFLCLSYGPLYDFKHFSSFVVVVVVLVFCVWA